MADGEEVCDFFQVSNNWPLKKKESISHFAAVVLINLAKTKTNENAPFKRPKFGEKIAASVFALCLLKRADS